MATREQADSAPPAGGGGGPSGPRAGFWRRFAAALLDGILLTVVTLPLRLVDPALGFGGQLLIGIIYFSMLEGGSRGQTFGKSALGIRVIGFEDGGPIGYGRGFIRYVGRYVSAIVVLAGYLWMLWDREKQTWHDKLAGAVVVPVEAYPIGEGERFV